MWACATASAEAAGPPPRRVELPEAVGCLGIAGRRTKREAALGTGGGHRHEGPAGADLAEHLVLGHLHIIGEDLGEACLAVDLGNGAHRHARRIHRNEEVGQAAVALGFGVGAEDAGAPVGEGAAAGPGLLAVEVQVAIVGPCRRAARERMPARSLPGVGLGPTLAPDLVAGRHGQEGVSAPSGPGSRTRHGGGEQEVPVSLARFGAGTICSSSKTSRTKMPTSRPPYSTGQLTTDQPISKQGVLPGAVGLEAFGGSSDGRDGLGACGAGRARALARNIFSWG